VPRLLPPVVRDGTSTELTLSLDERGDPLLFLVRLAWIQLLLAAGIPALSQRHSYALTLYC
jgi:hypothetical protein